MAQKLGNWLVSVKINAKYFTRYCSNNISQGFARHLGTVFPPQINLPLTLLGDIICSEKTGLPLINGILISH